MAAATRLSATTTATRRIWADDLTCLVWSVFAADLADGLGFEPKTALRLYSISSAAPSTGLGHPSRQRSLVAALWTLPTVGCRPITCDCRPTQHPRAGGARDDATVRHLDEQPVLDHPGRDLDRGRQIDRIVDAAVEHQVEDEVAVVRDEGSLLPASNRERRSQRDQPLGRRPP